MCAACRAEYEDPARPPLPRPAERLPGLRPAGAARCAPAGARSTAGEPDRGRRRRAAARRRRDRRGQGPRRLPPRLPRRRRSRRSRAARAQAPRGQAVRADGGATSTRPRALVELGDAERALLASAARGRSCSRRGARTRRSRAAVAPGLARARRDAALHAAAPPAARRRRRAAGADERQRLRRADRLPRRRRARAPGARSPTRSSSTTARSTRAPTTRSCARCGRARRWSLRRSRGYVPASVSAAGAGARGRCSPAAPS